MKGKTMSKRKKGAVRKNHGATCNICGLNCGKGGALKKHLEEIHKIDYDQYRKCFYNGRKENLIADTWSSPATTKGNKKDVLIHVFVRRFIGKLGLRGVKH